MMKTAICNPLLLWLLLAAASALIATAAEGESGAKPAEQSTTPASGNADRKPIARPDYQKDRLAFHRKHLLEAYRQFGQRDPRWNDEVEAFFDEWANRWADVQWRADPIVVLKLADAAIKAGCDDPLVRAGQMCMQNDNDGTVTPKLLEVANELAASKYAPYITACCAQLPVKLFEGNAHPDEEKFRASMQLVMEQVERCFHEDWIKPGDERFVYAILSAAVGCSNSSWPDGAPRFVKLVNDAKDKHQQWLAHMLAATYCRKQGWAARGTGFAQTVTPEGWRIFHENIAEMVTHLRKAYELMPEYPQAAADMITAVANGQGNSEDTIFLWFKRSVDAELDYGPAYAQMFNFGRPRWGGDYELMEKVGRYGLDTERFDTWAPCQYFYALAAISQDIPRAEVMFWETQLPKYYPQLERMFAGYETSEGMKEFRFYFRSLHIVMAYHAKRFEEALAELRKTEDKVHNEALQHAYKSLTWLVNSIHAFGGVAGGKALEAHALLDQRELDKQQLEEAQKLLQAAQEAYETAQDKPALALIAQLRASAELRKKLQSNDWVDLTFDETLTGWSPAAGNWKRKDEKTVAGTARNGLQLSLLAPTGHRMQLRGEIHIPKLLSDSDNAGVIFAGSNKPLRGIRFIIFPQPGQTRYYLGMNFGLTDQRPTDVRADRNQFEVTLWDRKLSVKLNGTVIQRALWLRDFEEFGDKECVALTGSYRGDSPEVIFRNLQLRTLLNPPDDF